jgi:hypothetical protein
MRRRKRSFEVMGDEKSPRGTEEVMIKRKRSCEVMGEENSPRGTGEPNQAQHKLS